MVRLLLGTARGRRAWSIYTRRVQRKEKTRAGSFAAVDVDSGDYAVGPTRLEALDRIREMHPKAKPYLFQIGGLARMRNRFRV